MNKKEYLKNFGINLNDDNTYTIDEVEGDTKKKIEYAYQKAWENRDFEINKYWSRAAYFWGFNALIFGAFLTIKKTSPTPEVKYELFTCCIGLIFATGWVLVNLGSKKWQENWEKHIDWLEDYVSGPVYKIVFNSGRSFSVSKINLILSVLIQTIWILLILNILISKDSPFLITSKNHWYLEVDLLIGIILTFAFIGTMLIFGRTGSKRKKGTFEMRNDD